MKQTKSQAIEHLNDMIGSLVKVKPTSKAQEKMAQSIAFQIEALAAMIAGKPKG